jgi:hypothetical protein
MDAEYARLAGLSAAVVRKPDLARSLLNRYLDLSVSTTGDAADRRQAMRVVRMLDAATQHLASSGPQNWFSGFPIEPRLPYCPKSGAFGLPIDRIETSKHLSLGFTWSPEGRLIAVARKFENLKRGRNVTLAILGGLAAGLTGAPTLIPQAGAEKDYRSFQFDYLADSSSVSRVAFRQHSEEATMSAFTVTPGANPAGADVTSFDPGKIYEDEDKKWAHVVLANHPTYDPLVIETLANPITTTVAGNPFFDPFEWKDLHVFNLTYDALGRLEVAQEVGSAHRLQFHWDGLRLLRLEAVDGPHRGYVRDLRYEGDRLVAENVSHRQLKYSVLYSYSGGELITAHLDDPGIVDERQRTVWFKRPEGRPSR